MKLYFFFFVFVFVFLVGTSAQVFYDNENLPRIIPATVTFNNNTGAVNSSDFWITVEGLKDNVVDLLTSEFTNDLGWFPSTNVAFLNNTQTFTEINTFDAGDGSIVQGNSQGTIVLKSTGTGNPAGSISFGNTADIGISNDGVVGAGTEAYDYDGAFIFKQATTNPDSLGEYIFLEENGDWRFALPSSQAGAGTYNPRSMIVAGPSKNNETNFYCAGWGATDIDCNTGGTGADLFVQDDFEIDGDIFAGGNLNVSSVSAYESDLIEVNSNINVTRPNEITGGMKVNIWFGNTGAFTGAFALRGPDRIITSATVGYLTMRSGIVTGVSTLCTVSGYSIAGTGQVSIEDQSNNVFISDNLAITGNGVITSYKTQSRTYTAIRHFTAGERIHAQWINFQPYTATISDCIVTVELTYDE